MPVYLVTGPDKKERLVEAANKASARNHASRQDYDVAVAGQADLFRIAKAGGEIETAGAEAEAEAQMEPEVEKPAEPLGGVGEDGELKPPKQK